ncbi:NF-kappa-B-repressing factor-like [Anopheles funestus]|uniref:NF-kappa-B-repressing factor-like n=1 Tax=Anopheles funestus TaxID=62324 RepID=UPI0020C6A488|nr:NF-kappa-B-repressing factor-like [Anopheles funestus]
MAGIRKTKVKLAAPKNKQKKALNKWSQEKNTNNGVKKPNRAKSDETKQDKKAANKPIVFVSPNAGVSSEDGNESIDSEQEQETVPKKLPVLQPVPTDIPDPQLDPRKIKKLQPLIGYIYNGDQLSLKQSFQQAGLLLTPDYDEKTRVFRFLVDTKEMCRAVGEKNEAHSIAREKLVQIVRYYCYTVKRVKEYHTRRKIFYTRPPKAAIQAQKDQKKIQEENVGFQMLQKQGWNPGSALGVSTEGIIEPIAVQRRKGKRGLGVEDAVAPDGMSGGKVKIPVEAFYLILQQYAGVNALYDIVFSSQFSKNQRAKLKNYAKSLKLMPLMIGQNKKKLVVSKPLTIKEIKEGVMKGHSDLCAKYVVIPPAAGIPQKDSTC